MYVLEIIEGYLLLGESLLVAEAGLEMMNSS